MSVGVSVKGNSQHSLKHQESYKSTAICKRKESLECRRSRVPPTVTNSSSSSSSSSQSVNFEGLQHTLETNNDSSGNRILFSVVACCLCLHISLPPIFAVI